MIYRKWMVGALALGLVGAGAVMLERVKDQPGRLALDQAALDREERVPVFPRASEIPAANAERQAPDSSNRRSPAKGLPRPSDVTPETDEEIESFVRGCLSEHRQNAVLSERETYQEVLQDLCRSAAVDEATAEFINAARDYSRAKTERTLEVYGLIERCLRSRRPLVSESEGRIVVSGTVSWNAPATPELWSGSGALVDFAYCFREGDSVELDEAQAKLEKAASGLAVFVRNKRKL